MTNLMSLGDAYHTVSTWQPQSPLSLPRQMLLNRPCTRHAIGH